MEFESPHPDKHMQQEKGQIEILLLILGIIGVLIFTGFFKSKGNSEVKPAVPSYQKENVAPSHGLKPSEPSPVPVSDGIAPYRFNPAPIEGLPSNTRQTVISLGTNEKAICKYSSISGVSYDAMQYTLSNSADGTLHYASITALNEGTAYNYYVKCLDQSGNKNTNDFVIAFWVDFPADFTPPVLSNAYPSGDSLPVGSFTIIGVSTNEPASCRYSWAQGTAYDSMSDSLSPADGTRRYHTATITGLVAGKAYDYFVRCKDLSGNVNMGDVKINFNLTP